MINLPSFVVSAIASLDMKRIIRLFRCRGSRREERMAQHFSLGGLSIYGNTIPQTEAGDDLPG